MTKAELTEKMGFNHDLFTRRLPPAVAALTDTSIDIPNRRAFDEILSQQWLRAIQERSYLSLLRVDINPGQLCADQLLSQVAPCLASGTRRPGDFVARIGDEEFAVVLPGTEEPGARALADDLLTKVQQLALADPSSTVSEQVTVSIGACTLRPSPQMSVDELLLRADMALHQAKNLGRNRALHYSIIAEESRRPEAYFS